MTQEVLTKDQVISIFQRSVISSAKKQTATSVAKEFGVSEKTVRDIWKGRTWYEETLPLDFNRVPGELKKMGRPPGRKDRTKRKSKTNAGHKAMSTQSSAVRSDLNSILQSHEKDTVQATSSTQLADSAQTSGHSGPPVLPVSRAVPPLPLALKTAHSAVSLRLQVQVAAGYLGPATRYPARPTAPHRAQGCSVLLRGFGGGGAAAAGEWGGVGQEGDEAAADPDKSGDEEVRDSATREETREKRGEGGGTEAEEEKGG